MLQQIFVDLMDEIDLIGAAVGQEDGLLRTGDAHGLLNHMMQQLNHLAVPGPIENFSALTAALDETGIAQGTEMMRNRGTGHVHHGGDVDHTFLTVAEHPEDTQPGRIAEFIKELGNHAEFPGAAERLLQKQAVPVVGVVVRQNRFGHGKNLLWSVWQHFSPVWKRVGEKA